MVNFKYFFLASLLVVPEVLGSPVHARDGDVQALDKPDKPGNNGQGQGNQGQGNQGQGNSGQGNSGQGNRIRNDTVQVPEYQGKPKDRSLEVKAGKFFVKVQAKQTKPGSLDAYKFYYTTHGYPRFYNSFFNATMSKNASTVASWGYDMALVRIFEFEDTGVAGYDNETVLSEIPLSGAGKVKGWSPIVYNRTVVENATVYRFGSSLKVNNLTEINISFAISSAQIRSALNSTVVLQPNSIKWDLTIRNYNFTSVRSTLAFESIVRSFDRVTRVNRNVTNRNDTEIPNNRTVPANNTRLVIGNGNGRVGFESRVDIADANGKKSIGTVLVSAPVNDTRPDIIDQDEKKDKSDRGEDDDDDDKKESEALGAKGGNRVRMFFTFRTENGTLPNTLFWDPEVNVNDVSDSNGLTATDLAAVISQPDTAGAVLDAPADTTTPTSPTSPNTNVDPQVSPSAGPKTKTNDASQVRQPSLLIVLVGLGVFLL